VIHCLYPMKSSNDRPVFWTKHKHKFTCEKQTENESTTPCKCRKTAPCVSLVTQAQFQHSYFSGQLVIWMGLFRTTPESHYNTEIDSWTTVLQHITAR